MRSNKEWILDVIIKTFIIINYRLINAAKVNRHCWIRINLQVFFYLLPNFFCEIFAGLKSVFLNCYRQLKFSCSLLAVSADRY